MAHLIIAVTTEPEKGGQAASASNPDDAVAADAGGLEQPRQQSADGTVFQKGFWVHGESRTHPISPNASGAMPGAAAMMTGHTGANQHKGSMWFCARRDKDSIKMVQVLERMEL
jgi:hypothetical protein